MSAIILDDHLMNWNGHNANYALSLHREFTRRQVKCLVCGHATARDLGGIEDEFVPVFRTCAALMKVRSGSFQRVRKLLRLVKANWCHLADLTSRVTELLKNGDLLILADASPRTTPSYGIWLALLSARRKHVSVVWLVHDAPSQIIRLEGLFLRMFGCGHSIMIAAQSSAIADRVKQLTNIPVFVVPTPQACGEPVEPEPQVAESAPTICYLGGASRPKGFDIFVQAVVCLDDLVCAGQLRIICQCNSYDDAPDLAREVSMIKRLGENTPAVTVYGSALQPDEYYRVLRESDVVVLPYRAQYYQFIQSGVFAEALSLGKPVIVPENCFLATELSRIGAGLTFRSEDATSLSDAIRKAIAMLGSLKTEGVAASHRYREWHNAGNYIDILLDRTGSR